MSNGTLRWGRLLFFTGSSLVPLSLLLVPLLTFSACGSDGDAANQSSLAPPPDYVPVEAAAQNPLPPGAGGPRPDAGGPPPPPPPPVDAAGGDTSTPIDANLADSAADSGPRDATGQ